MHKIVENDIRGLISNLDLKVLSGKKILITGSNGLIGSYFVNLLNIAGKQGIISDCEVVCISRSKPSILLDDAINNNMFHFLSEDLVKLKKYPLDCDYIIHGATYAQPKKFVANKMNTVKLNTEVTDRLLNACLDNGSVNFLYLSSSEIYGDVDRSNIPTHEDYNGNCSTLGPRAVYAESKRLGETICDIYREDYGFNIKIARISSVYGPGISINDERVMGNFLRQALLNNKINLIDRGESIRTFCYITDCIKMLSHVLLNGKSFVYNIGGIDTISIKELAQKICEITNSKFVFPDIRKAYDVMEKTPNIVQLDISKALNEFKINDFVNIDIGLKNTVAWNKDVFL